MNEVVIALACMIGVVVGYLFGIFQNKPEESKFTRELERNYCSLMLDLQKGFEKRAEIYKQEINRLNEIIAQNARDRVVEHPEAAKRTDFVEISLERGGYKEIDLSGRAER